jgi:hypothetical protein
MLGVIESTYGVIESTYMDASIKDLAEDFSPLV